MVNSVRTRLTLWYIGVLAVVLVAFSAGVYALIERNTQRRVDTELQQTMEGTAGLLILEMTERDSDIAASKSESEDEEGETRGEEIETKRSGTLRAGFRASPTAAFFR